MGNKWRPVEWTDTLPDVKYPAIGEWIDVPTASLPVDEEPPTPPKWMENVLMVAILLVVAALLLASFVIVQSYGVKAG